MLGLRLQGHLHGVCELLRSLSLLREHGMRRLSDGDAAQRLADGVAQLLGRRLLRGRSGQKDGVRKSSARCSDMMR